MGLVPRRVKPVSLWIKVQARLFWLLAFGPLMPALFWACCLDTIVTTVALRVALRKAQAVRAQAVDERIQPSVVFWQGHASDVKGFGDPWLVAVASSVGYAFGLWWWHDNSWSGQWIIALAPLLGVGPAVFLRTRSARRAPVATSIGLLAEQPVGEEAASPPLLASKADGAGVEEGGTGDQGGFVAVTVASTASFSDISSFNLSVGPDDSAQ